MYRGCLGSNPVLSKKLRIVDSFRSGRPYCTCQCVFHELKNGENYWLGFALGQTGNAYRRRFDKKTRYSKLCFLLHSFFRRYMAYSDRHYFRRYCCTAYPTSGNRGFGPGFIVCHDRHHWLCSRWNACQADNAHVQKACFERSRTIKPAWPDCSPDPVCSNPCRTARVCRNNHGGA